ncbi:PAS domain S-box-containing protein [Desulfobotulus alkaliphilus]|uniref:histidine kinase n=1 Tax=Desulfobotulus alkaliphilus TaxID=622671 RepID=A0A562R6A4_9BACT|nr:PAS domain S-box protein [Desulfobotulus alkaliphilus]TWI64612.1 PAS domain S-box-containing protein [Desulfobotulus alkaliphilus]
MTIKPSYEELEKRVHELEKNESEHKYSKEILNVYEKAFLGYQSLDENGRYIAVNQIWLDTLGYTRDEVIGRSFTDFLHPDWRGKFKEKFSEFKCMGEILGAEFKLLKKNGNCIQVSLTGQIVRDKNKNFLQTHCIFQDITQHRLAEDALREKSLFLHNIIDCISDLVSVTDMEGNFIFIGSTHRILGYEPDFLIGKNAIELVHPDDHQKMATAFKDFLANREDGRMVEYRFRRADGEYIWLETIGKFILDDAGNPKNILFSSRDFTARKKTEEEIAKRELTLNKIFDVLPIGLWFADKNGKLLRGNPAGIKIWGAEPTVPIEEYGVFKARRLPSGEEIAPDDWALAHTIKKGVTIKDELLEIDAFDGQKKIILNYTAPVINDRGEMLGAVIVNNDITEQKRAEEQREKLQAQLNQAQKMESIGRLAGGVAHDFNNMLGVILGHAELALMRADAKQNLYADLIEIEKAAKRSADITKQLLAFARKEIIYPKKLDLNDTVEKMLTMLRRLIGENIDLIWKSSSHLLSVKMDPSQIDQILANLCINARDAISGVGKITIETGKHTFDEEYCKVHAGFIPGDFVMLVVSDNGCGMDKETQKNLFEPFFTTKEVGKGTGLGLATVYGIIKQNNGFINVYSEPGQGSTFRIYLPRLLEPDCVHTEEIRKKTATGGTETILLVEDEPMILDMTRNMLEMMGYKVLASTLPSEAIKTVKNFTGTIHLLISDVVMPEMNGAELSRQIKDIYPGIQLLFMSGYTANIITHQGVLDSNHNKPRSS